MNSWLNPRWSLNPKRDKLCTFSLRNCFIKYKSIDISFKKKKQISRPGWLRSSTAAWNVAWKVTQKTCNTRAKDLKHANTQPCVLIWQTFVFAVSSVWCLHAFAHNGHTLEQSKEGLWVMSRRDDEITAAQSRAVCLITNQSTLYCQMQLCFFYWLLCIWGQDGLFRRIKVSEHIRRVGGIYCECCLKRIAGETDDWNCCWTKKQKLWRRGHFNGSQVAVKWFESLAMEWRKKHTTIEERQRERLVFSLSAGGQNNWNKCVGCGSCSVRSHLFHVLLLSSSPFSSSRADRCRLFVLVLSHGMVRWGFALQIFK